MVRALARAALSLFRKRSLAAAHEAGPPKKAKLDEKEERERLDAGSHSVQGSEPCTVSHEHLGSRPLCSGHEQQGQQGHEQQEQQGNEQQGQQRHEQQGQQGNEQQEQQRHEQQEQQRHEQQGQQPQQDPQPPEEPGGSEDSGLSQLECPVCVDTMESPVRQCVNGHCVCNPCRTRVSACPLCRGQLSPHLHPQLDQLARTLTLPCAMSKRGCKHRLKVRERESHLLACRYNARACPLTPCDWVGPHCELRDHALSQHPARAHHLPLGASLTYRFEVQGGDVRSALGVEDGLLLTHDEILHLAVHTEELPGRVAVTVRQLAAGRLRPPPITCTLFLCGRRMSDLVKFQHAALGEEEQLVTVAEDGRCLLVDMEEVKKMMGEDVPQELLLRCTLSRDPPDGWLTTAMAWVTERLWAAGGRGRESPL